VHPDRRSWLPAGIWALIAVASVAVAAAVALRPGHLQDLHLVRTWLEYAWHHSADPYAYFDRELDYPPLALLLLAPLGWISDGTLTAWFLPASVVITAVAVWALVNAIAERVYAEITTPQRVAIVAMILSTSSVRGAIWRGQTVALAVLFGALALSWTRRRPVAAGLMLALCSFKLHLAFGFGLAILLLDGPWVVIVAGASALSLSIFAAATMGQSPLVLAVTYARNLFAIYAPPGHIGGLLSVRWVFEELVDHYGAATLLYAVAAIASLVLIVRAARRAPDAAGRAQVTAAALLWPLLFLPSQLYNGMLAAPAVWLLMWPESGLIRRQSKRVAVVAAFVMFSVLDVPRLLRFISGWIEDGYWLYKGSYYLSPLRLLLMFGFVLFVAFRRARASQQELSV